MDPNAALADLLRHLADGDADEAADLARNLAEWIGRGGFAPAALAQASLAADLAR